MFKTLSCEGKPIGWRSGDLALNNYVTVSLSQKLTLCSHSLPVICSDAIIGLNATVAEHKEGTELTFCINLVRKIGGAIRREVVYNPVLNGITAGEIQF